MSGALRNPATWAKALKKAKIPADSLGADYVGMLKFEIDVVKTGEYSVTADNEFFLVRGFRVAAGSIIPNLKARHWRALLSPSGSFIGSDNPVVMDGPKDRMIGFRSADLVFFTVNRHVLLYGTNVPVRRPFVNRKLIASQNTFTMLTSDEQLFSHVADFCWLDPAGKIQTDWALFSKESVIQSIES